MSVQPATVRTLVLCQWGAVVAAMVTVFALRVPAWGAWVPALAYVVGTAAWVWTLSPDKALADRETLKALALGAGVRGSAVVCAGLLGAHAIWPDALALAWTEALAVTAVLGVVGVPVATMLSLVGLDAGRTQAAPSRRQA